MKVVILAGGMGTRIGEESQYRPKPMVEVGGRPILWHIMKHYSSYGYNEFVICCGYKGHMIKEYFTKYYMEYSDLNINLKSGKTNYFQSNSEHWKVTMINTGVKTLTAGRILGVRNFIDGDEFMLTYGDGVSDVNIHKLVDFHHQMGRISTITVTKPEGRFGAAKIDEKSHKIEGFKEKARKDQSFVNAGFMVCSTKVFDYLGDGSEMLEAGPFEKIVVDGEMNAYEHDGFWSPMDSLKDRNYLEELWASGNAPWKVW